MERLNVKQTALDLLRSQGRITSGELAAASDVSRQTAHGILSTLVTEGLAVAVGAGRGSHYVPAGQRLYRWGVEGLEEHVVWADLHSDDALVGVGEPALSVLQYAVMEMVNNVIDHSGAPEVTARVSRTEDVVFVSIEDRGIGALERVKAALGLESHLDALAQLSKGKLTTDPERHTGEGIFFTSKVVDRFTLSSNGIEWTVDNLGSDVAVGRATSRQGTSVALAHDALSQRTIESVFGEFTSGFTFDRSHVVVKLFEHGDSFVSRSEARRVAVGLDAFATVVVDFAGVERVGQGFVDELFRVWAADHPDTTLEPVQMNEPVEFMVRRGLPER